MRQSGRPIGQPRLGLAFSSFDYCRNTVVAHLLFLVPFFSLLCVEFLCVLLATPALSFLTRHLSHGILLSSGILMKPIRLLASLTLTAIASLPVAAQNSGFNPPRANAAKSPPRAEAYYNFTLGHMFELQFEQTNQGE